jgi:hypothetical protein
LEEVEVWGCCCVPEHSLVAVVALKGVEAYCCTAGTGQLDALGLERWRMSRGPTRCYSDGAVMTVSKCVAIFKYQREPCSFGLCEPAFSSD